MERPRITRVSRRWLVAGVVVALLAVAGVVVWARARSGPETRLATAMALAPRTAVRFSWTDWAAVRQRLGVSSTQAEDHMGQLLSKAFDADLSSETALGDSAATMARKLGVSPANLEWELYAQGTDGAVDLMGLPDDLDLATLRSTLRTLGYRASADGGSDGVWRVDAGRLTSIGTLTPELTNLTIDTDHRVLAASDSAAFLGAWRDHERGSGGSGGDDALAEVVAAVGDARTAAVYGGDYACQSLAMSQADPADQAEAARLISDAGKINPLDAFAIANEPDGDVWVAMAFESADQARTNADTRAKLAVGPAPGQGGSFPDRFRLVRSTADGDVVTLTLHPHPDNYVLSDLATGPLLFASC